MDEVKEAGVPMEGQEQVVDQGDEAEEVGVVGVALGAIHERPELVDLDQAEDSEYGFEAQAQIKEVQGQETEAVDVEHGGVQVVLAQLRRVRLENAILEGKIFFLVNPSFHFGRYLYAYIG